MAATAAAYGVVATGRAGLPGLWVDADGPVPRKLGAVGVRIERGVAYHGIALNVTTDLRDFDLIDPCGMTGIGVTSIAREAGWRTERQAPSTESVADAADQFAKRLAPLVGAALAWIAPVPARAVAAAG